MGQLQDKTLNETIDLIIMLGHNRHNTVHKDMVGHTRKDIVDGHTRQDTVNGDTVDRTVTIRQLVTL